MESILLEILAILRAQGSLDPKGLEAIIRRHNRSIPSNADHHAKKKLMPYYLHVKQDEPKRWQSWGLTPQLEQQLLGVLRIKPRRTASGVATITVLTKPWKCSSNCLYCPNDLTMPKSYLGDEPACQRAERNYFDPFLQVAARLQALTQMGHVTDKVELIILGGTWSDYPRAYQIWFVQQLFCALNVASSPAALERGIAQRIERYRSCGLSNSQQVLRLRVAPLQQQVNQGQLTFNQAWSQLYQSDETWQALSQWQEATLPQLEEQQRANETAQHRVVGLVVETRPDTVSVESLTLLRQLGCTKIQMGVQSLDQRLLKLNDRGIDVDRVRQAFQLVRLFGFKIHAHFMVNLLGATPQGDIEDYARFIADPAFQPDEVKLYPCVLIGGTRLVRQFQDGAWQPYDERQLIDVLTADVLATPSFVRISRMIRDFSAHDIVAGNKKINLRQKVELHLERQSQPVREIRYREISTESLGLDQLTLDEVHYDTSVSHEVFLQWITPQGKIAGFLRLSLPHPAALTLLGDRPPIQRQAAMIREVHVYGKVAGISRDDGSAQHAGLGKQLIQRARCIAKQRGYQSLNVISSVGTREYYRARGFSDGSLYQSCNLE